MPSREYFNNRRRDRRQRLYQILGGKCSRCGSKKSLEFDHKNPKDKNFIIADKIDAPFSLLEKEIQKCRLLCSQCHRRKTLENDEFGIPSNHGTLWRYKKYKCRCDKCKQVMREYNQAKRIKMLEEASDKIKAFLSLEEIFKLSIPQS